MLDHLGTWSDMLPLVEFTYIGMAPYEALYGKSSPKRDVVEQPLFILGQAR